MTVCAVVLLGLGGCDNQAAERARSGEAYRAAVAVIAASDQGYVPTGSDNQPMASSLELYRQGRLAEAIAGLQEVAQSGTPQQRQSARQLLADIHASAARHDLRQAMSAWADLANRSANLVSDLVAIDRANTRVDSFQVDDSELLRKLEDNQTETRRRVGELNVNRQQLDGRIIDIEGKIAEQQKRGDEAQAQARKLRDEAFLASGDVQFDLYDQASQQERRSARASAEAQKLGVKLDIYQSERVILTRQIESAEKFLASMQQQVQEIGQRQGQIRESRQAAEADKVRHIQRLDEQITAMAKDFESSVEATFLRAESNMEQALQVMEAAVRDASGSDARAVELERLGKLLTKVHILSSHILAVGDLASTLSVIAVRAGGGEHPLMPEKAVAYQTGVDRLVARQEALITQSSEAIVLGRELVEKLVQGAAETDPIADTAHKHAGELDGYRTRINSLRMKVATED